MLLSHTQVIAFTGHFSNEQPRFGSYTRVPRTIDTNYAHLNSLCSVYTYAPNLTSHCLHFCSIKSHSWLDFNARSFKYLACSCLPLYTLQVNHTANRCNQPAVSVYVLHKIVLRAYFILHLRPSIQPFQQGANQTWMRRSSAVTNRIKGRDFDLRAERATYSR